MTSSKRQNDFRDRPLVLFGAGALGQRILGGLRKAGIEPCAFSDNNQALHGWRVQGIETLSPAAAASRYGNSAIFVICVWRPAQSGGLRDIDCQLRQLGCEDVVPFPHVLWSFPDTLLPHYLWDLPANVAHAGGQIAEALALFEDAASRAEFLAQVEFRKTGDFKLLLPIQKHPQYFPEFLKRAADDCFVDCGAYDGDSIAAFLHWAGGRFAKVVAFEADPGNIQKLKIFAEAQPGLRNRFVCHPEAVAATAGVVRFDATGQSGASISGAGGIEVRAARLDDVLENERPTFIKMDIEGAEDDALRGCRKTIERAQPILAICVYHEQNHLWKIPLLIRELLPEAKFFLRTYCLDGLDTVCYAVPESRLAADYSPNATDQAPDR